MDKIRVLIADDHAIVREGFRRLLEDQPNIAVLGEAGNGAEAVRMAGELAPDVVLMDVTMPGLDGLDATHQIKEQSPNVKVLMLTVHESEEIFFKAIEVGASGYFVKGGSSAELLTALEAVARGDTFRTLRWQARSSDSTREAKRGRGPGEAYAELSDRETEISTFLADGRNNREIGEGLGLSPNTVQAHRARLMIKLGLHTRTDLIKYAVKKGNGHPG